MNYSRYKSEHVADHLREEIARGELADPLPSLREWSSNLGVSPGTLQAALKILKREGWIGARAKKGYFLLRKPRRSSQHSPLVRWVLFDPKHQGAYPMGDLLMSVGQKLSALHIDFQIERCNDVRIRAIHKTGSRAHEMLVFSNLSLTYQRLFEGFKNALIFGLPLPGIRLPYISSDVFPAIRHATYRLLRLGCDRIDLVNVIGRRVPESFQRLEDEFQKIRAEAPQIFDGEVIWLPGDPVEQSQALQKFAARIRGKQGFVVNSPISPGLIVMVLTSMGFKIPEQFEVLPVNCMPSQLIVYPQLAHYPFPLEQISKIGTKAAIHYFETGALPDLHKDVPLELVVP